MMGLGQGKQNHPTATVRTDTLVLPEGEDCVRPGPGVG